MEIGLEIGLCGWTGEGPTFASWESTLRREISECDEIHPSY